MQQAVPVPFVVDPGAAARTLHARAAARQRRLRGKWRQASRDFQRIRDVIVHKYAPKRVYQWGSLLAPERFSEISDIDIAIEGIRSAADYFAMLGDAMELTAFPLDLVDLDKIDPLHAAGIRQYGRLVYSRIPGETKPNFTTENTESTEKKKHIVLKRRGSAPRSPSVVSVSSVVK